MTEQRNIRDELGDDFDPHAPEFVVNPAPIYERLRDECPIIHSDKYGGFWMLTRYGDIKSTVMDWETYTSAIPGVTTIPPTQPRDYPQIPIEFDPPEHTKYRGLINPIFRSRRVAEMKPDLDRIAGTLVDDILAKGEAELVEDFAVPMSVGTLATLMGLPREDEDKWAEWVRRMFEGSILNPEEQKAALTEFEAYLDGLIEERKEKHADDFISLLLDSEIDGERLNDTEIRGFGILMLMAGHETTASAMGVTLMHLAQHSGTRHALNAAPDLIPTAVEEFLRLASPIQFFARNTTREVEVHGEEIPEGDVVALAYASANRDPEIFDEPNQCVLNRKPNRHFTFGWGHHLCVGAHVARLELQVMLEQFTSRVPEFSIKPGAEIRWKSRGDVRGLASLPVVIG